MEDEVKRLGRHRHKQERTQRKEENRLYKERERLEKEGVEN